MVLSVARASLLLAASLGAEPPAPAPLPLPPLKSTPEILPVRTARHFLVRIQLVEVDDQGRETVLGEPRLKTAGGNAGVSIDHPDGRRFDFTVRLTDRVAAGALGDLIPAPAATQTVSRESVARKLDQKLDLDLVRVPRREALREISRRSGVSMAIEPDTVRAVVDEMDVPIDLKVKDEPVSRIIQQLIEPLNLTYVVKQDVVLISHLEPRLEGPEEFVVRTYDVTPLLTAMGDEEQADEFTRLIKQIRTTIRPGTWESPDKGPAITPFKSSRSIVVRQTPSVHAEISRMLEKIRQEQPSKVPPLNVPE